MKEKNGGSLKHRLIHSALDLPGMPDSRLPHIEAQGNREFIIDGCKGILEYEEGRIKLNTDCLTVSFTGKNVEIKAYSDIQTVVSGNIYKIEFEEQGSN